MIWIIVFLVLVIIGMAVVMVYIRNERDMMWIRREEHLKILDAEVDRWVNVCDTLANHLDPLKKAVLAYDSALRVKASEPDKLEKLDVKGAIARGEDLGKLYFDMVNAANFKQEG